MIAQTQQELESAVKSNSLLDEIVALLRRYKQPGVTQQEVYSFLQAWHGAAPDQATDDRILEVANIVAGFCASHMKVWDHQGIAS